tara:strand:- start:6057 stop:7304 length:1248 start_codon:yes stop_codon:yes gene_type:complete
MYLASALITNDAVVLGLLLAILAAIFITSNSDNPIWKKFYTFVPSLLLCYFVPSIFTTLGVISAEESNLYFVASRYLLPASLVLLTLSIDFKGVLNLGWKAVAMFLAGSFGIIIGGPLALLIIGAINPDIVGGVGPDEVWKGMATIAGSWIGGGANQAAMQVMYEPSDKLFSAMVTVDIIVANIWMAFLLYGAGMSDRVDKWFKADSSAIDALRKSIESYQASISRVPTFVDITKIVAVAFVITGVGHIVGDFVGPWIGENAPALKDLSLDSAFFWIIVTATTGGLIASFTKLRTLEGAGASKIGSLFLYILVATIGMQMDLSAFVEVPGFFAIGIVWILIHIIILLSVGKLIRAPFFFTAVGSQANIGGAASAPIVASAFHPALAPVGVLLAVLGYALGTYGAWMCAEIMKALY